MNNKLIIVLIILGLMNSCINSSDAQTHVYVQAFYKQDSLDLKLYSVYQPKVLNVPFDEYKNKNKWLDGYLKQTFSGEPDFVELDERNIAYLKEFLSNAADVKVFSDYSYKNRGALVLCGKQGNIPTCETLYYEITDDGAYVLQRKFVPVTLAANEVYKQCIRTGKPPVLGKVTNEDFSYFYKEKCNGLCVEKQGIIYQNSLPDKEMDQLVDSLMVFVESKMTDLTEDEKQELRKPKIVVFDDVLFVRNQINRYERSFVLFNIRFKKVNDLWVYDTHNEIEQILEFIKVAEKEYD